MIELDSIKYDEKGLVPVVVQAEDSKEVLMLGYMNKESLQKTIETKRLGFTAAREKNSGKKGRQAETTLR